MLKLDGFMIPEAHILHPAQVNMMLYLASAARATAALHVMPRQIPTMPPARNRELALTKLNQGQAYVRHINASRFRGHLSFTSQLQRSGIAELLISNTSTPTRSFPRPIGRNFFFLDISNLTRNSSRCVSFHRSFPLPCWLPASWPPRDHQPTASTNFTQSPWLLRPSSLPILRIRHSRRHPVITVLPSFLQPSMHDLLASSVAISSPSGTCSPRAGLKVTRRAIRD